MLKQRILTALILVPLVIWAIIGLAPQPFALMMGAIMLGCAWEWTRMAGIQSLVPRLGYLLLLAGIGAGLWQQGLTGPLAQTLISWGALGWLLALVWVIGYNLKGHSPLRHPLAKALVGVWILVPAWLAMVWLRQVEGDGRDLIFYLLLLIWSADSFAYFAGRRFGRVKLAPKVSPGKSWEGVIGGLLGVLLLTLVWVWAGGEVMLPLWLFVAWSLVTALASVLGDLVESLAKREVGLKDSGHLLPGHGGLFDRLDSLMAAAPVFAAGWMLQGGLL